jgi:6-phosphofructokinase 1
VGFIVDCVVMKSIAVLTSGGDAPGMNAAVRAVAKVAAARGVRVLGVEEGYDGLIDRRLRPLTIEVNGALRVDPTIDRASCVGGTVLGSARCARFRTPEGRAEAARSLDGIGLIVIGGDGSLTGAHTIAREHGVKFVGIPASIDNDIGCTSSALGVDTALNTIVDACDKITDTASSHRRAFVVEVMGRRSGYLAMASAVAVGADGVLLPEQSRSEDAVVSAVEKLVREGFDGAHPKRRVLIIKAEGVEVPCTRLVRLVEERIKNADIRATVLGHLVRGGAPSYADRMLANRLALAAVDGLLAGATDEMAAWLPTVRGGIDTTDPYVKRFPMEQVLTETKALLDGTSAATKWRLALLERVEGVLPL